MSTTENTDVHAKEIGMFYRISGDYIERFKKGGNQKLQRLIGEDLFYKKGNRWWWNNPVIVRMSISELKILTKKIQDAQKNKR